LSLNVEEEEKELDFLKPLDQLENTQYPIIRDRRDWWLGSDCKLWNNIGPRCPCGKSSCIPKIVKLRKLERFFGSLGVGDMFGESCMFVTESDKYVPSARFY